MSEYPNPRPGQYTLHVPFTADDDSDAVEFAKDLQALIATSKYSSRVNLDEPPFVSDTDDWAEHVTTECQAAELKLWGACFGGLERTGNGRRLCTGHRYVDALV